MKLIHAFAWTTCLLITPPLLLAQKTEEKKPTDRAQEEDKPTFGIRLKPSIVNGFIDQFVQRMERQYDLTPDQIVELQDLFKERIPKFLLENQADAELLANDFLEAVNRNDPPTPEFVANWAQRALPLLQKASVFAGETSEAMKDHLTDEQAVKLDSMMAAIDVGVTMTNKRLQNWAAGNYDPKTEWHKNPGARELDDKRRIETLAAMESARRDTLREYGMEPETHQSAAANAAPESLPPASDPRSDRATKPKAQPKDEWAKYVDNFIARYELDAEQQQKARLNLDEAYQQKNKYLESKARIVEKLTASFDEAKKKGDKDAIAATEQQYQDLMKPTERYFDRLKEKLDRLPTREQRRKATQKDEQAEKAAAPPAAELGGERAQRP